MDIEMLKSVNIVLAIIQIMMLLIFIVVAVYVEKIKKKAEEAEQTLLEIKELMKKDVAKKPATTWVCPKCKTVNDAYSPKCKCGFEKNW